MEESFEYPIMNLSGLTMIGAVNGGFSPVFLGEDGKKIVYKKSRCKWQGHINEVVYSKLAKLIDIRAAKNTFAVLNKGRGIASEYFLNNSELITPLQDKIKLAPDGCFQSMRIEKVLKLCRDELSLHSDFEKNFIESYLFSVLMANYDHAHNHNILITQDSKNGETNMSPYHDMEMSSFDYPGKTTGHNFINDYYNNVPILRTKFKEIHEKFLDNASTVDCKKLTCFKLQHIYNYADYENDPSVKRSIDLHSENLSKKIPQQLKLMKNYNGKSF